MLLKQKVKVKWSNNKTYYTSLGYDYTGFGQEFYVDIIHLPKNSNKRIKYKCDSCLNIFETTYQAYNRTSKGDKDLCVKCCSTSSSLINKASINSLQDMFPEIAKEFNKNKNKLTAKDYGYGSKQHVWWMCSEGHKWETSINNRTGKNSKCPYCTKRESSGEGEIRKYLEKINAKYKKEYSFKNLLSENGRPLKFDFAILENDNIKLLIEYDGEQHFGVVGVFGEEHFKTTQYRDNLKNNYCKENNIPLLRIPYWEFNNIEKIIREAF